MKIAIIAHDGKKAEMVGFLSKHHIVVCDVHNIRLAINPALAELILKGHTLN